VGGVLNVNEAIGTEAAIEVVVDGKEVDAFSGNIYQ
jgi:hypothetical protein